MRCRPLHWVWNGGNVSTSIPATTLVCSKDGAAAVPTRAPSSFPSLAPSPETPGRTAEPSASATPPPTDGLTAEPSGVAPTPAPAVSIRTAVPVQSGEPTSAPTLVPSSGPIALTPRYLFLSNRTTSDALGTDRRSAQHRHARARVPSPAVRCHAPPPLMQRLADRDAPPAVAGRRGGAAPTFPHMSWTSGRPVLTFLTVG